MKESPILFIVDDDADIRISLKTIAQTLDLPAREFTSAEAFLSAYNHESGCLILDMDLPQASGKDVQRRMLDRGITLPIIILSGQIDVPLAVESMRLGALTVLEKPCHLYEIAGHIREALTVDRQRRLRRLRAAKEEALTSKLTAKEHEVWELVTMGHTNRQIAGRLHLSLRAVEDRRSRLMKKLGVRNVAELIQRGLRRTSPDR